MMNTESLFSIRAMRLEDVDALTPVMKAAFDEDTRRHTDLMEDGPEGYDDGRLLRGFLADPDAFCRTLWQGSRRIGALVYRKEGDVCVGDILFVDPSLHGFGFGRQAMAGLESEAAGCRLIRLETPDYSTRNHRFYEHCGYRRLDEPGLWAQTVVFAKDLPEDGR